MILLTLAACTSEETQTANNSSKNAILAQENPIPEYLIGEWELVNMVIYSDGDSSRITPEEAGMSVIAINNANGSFKDIFNGKAAEGRFYLKSDTAIFDYDNSSKRIFTYHFADDTLSYKGRMNGQLMKTMFVKTN